MTRLYVETSALVRALLEGDHALRSALTGSGRPFTSALTFVEAARAVARARRERRLSAEEAAEAERALAGFERTCALLAIDDRALRRAREEFPEEPVRSLDAIHLSSLLILDEAMGDFVVASCDDRVRRNAEALGFEVVPATLAAP